MRKIILTLGIMAMFGACKGDFDPTFELPKPESWKGNFSESVLVNKLSPENPTSTFSADGTYSFVAKLNKATQNDGEASLVSADFKQLVSDYNKFKGVTDYTLLPSTHYDFTKGSFKKGETSTEVQLTIKDYENLEQGDYVLPLTVDVEGQKLTHLIFVRKDAAYVALSETSKKPLPSGSYSCTQRTEPMKMVAYVETNDWDIRNMGQFLLKDSKKPVFDMVVLFAANMNYDAKAGKRILHFNDKLQPIVNDPEKYIKPLKNRGIKVIIDILPNHQGVGYYNFQNYEEALEFARECKMYTDKLGIDGWDIDEEYADYHVLPQKPRKGGQSVLWFMRAMKEVMPDKLLTMYDYSLTGILGLRDELGKEAKDYVDYGWTDYGLSHSSTIGLPNEKYGTRSIQYGQSQGSRTSSAAQANLRGCYGILMCFNITGPLIKGGGAKYYLSQATQLFYGEECIFEGKYHNGPRDN